MEKFDYENSLMKFDEAEPIEKVLMDYKLSETAKDVSYDLPPYESINLFSSYDFTSTGPFLFLKMENDNLDSSTKTESKLEPSNTSPVSSCSKETCSSKDECESNQAKNTRWGNEQDKEVFIMLNRYLNETHIGLTDFVKDSKITDDKKAILSLIANELGWKRRLKHLYSRIKKLSKSPDQFSIRELKLFKRILRNQLRNRALNYNELLDQFPGKTFDVVKQLADDLEKTY